MGTALTDRAGRRAQAARAARCCSARTPTRPARRRCAARRVRVFNAARRRRARGARRPAPAGPRSGRRRRCSDGADAMRALLDARRAGRALRRSSARSSAAELDDARGPRPRAERGRADRSPGSSPGLLQDDLVQLVADRLQMPEARDRTRRCGACRARAARRNGDAPAGRGAAPRMRHRRSTSARTTERAFLARCLAVKDAGRAGARGDGHRRAPSRSELTRRAAHYLAEHLEHPGQALPAGADDLARLSPSS